MMMIKTLNMIRAAVLLEVARDPSRGHLPALLQQLQPFHKTQPQQPAILYMLWYT